MQIYARDFMKELSNKYIQANSADKWNMSTILKFATTAEINSAYGTILAANKLKARVGGQEMPLWYGPLFAVNGYYNLNLAKEWLSSDLNHLYGSYNPKEEDE